MIKFLSIAALWSLLLATSAWAGSSDGPVALITPPDQSVLESALVSVALKIQPGSVDEIQIWVNGRKQALLRKKIQQYAVCFDGMELAFGLNRLKIVGIKGGKHVAQLTSQVFFRSDLSSNASSAPDGFTRYLFHSSPQEKECAACHKLDFSGYDGGETTAEKSPCYQCHKKMLSNYQTVHGPAAVWSCLSCHDQKATPKLAVVHPEKKVCDNCHENSWDAMKFGHGPTAAGSCATCHNPHASDYPYFLRMPGGNLCAGCHEDILHKPHVIIGFSNNGHPVRKGVDPSHPTKSFSCISCHNPHAGSSWTFLNGYDGVSEITTFCRTCHIM